MLEKLVDENLSIIYSDQDKIRQIILNLLSNAAKFTHAGKILLAANQDGENLRISVRDTGIGISAEALPRIFKNFNRPIAPPRVNMAGLVWDFPSAAIWRLWQI
jgi:signal transduction histidine kinase